MNVLIIEDERYAADKLKLLLQQIDPEISVINTLETVEGAVNWFRENASPDLILMDIQLSDGICFEIFEVIKINTPVIFITAYDEYAIRAFKVNSVDYLLKPVDQDALTGAIQKFKTLFPKKDADSNRIDRLVEALVKNYRTRFLVKVGLHYNSVLTNEIECFCINERSLFLRTVAGKIFDLDYSLDQIQTMVDPVQFFRINRNYIINIHYITQIISYSTSRLLVKLTSPKQDDDLIVSRDKVSEFKHWLDR